MRRTPKKSQLGSIFSITKIFEMTFAEVPYGVLIQQLRRIVLSWRARMVPEKNRKSQILNGKS